MQLIILDTATDLEAGDTLYSEIESRIQQKAQESNLHFSHLQIDGQTIYDNYEQYISENAGSINEIRVEMITLEQLNQDILESAQDYIVNAGPKIHSLSEEFYKNPSTQTWTNLEQFLEAIEWLSSMLVNIQEQVGEELQQSLAVLKDRNFEQLEALLQAMENKDTILIGDILKYEITALFSDLSEVLDKIK